MAFPPPATVTVAAVRVAVVAESFLPRVNGVTGSVCRVLEQLAARGHEAMVVAPEPAPPTYAGAPVVTVPGLELPGYAGFPVGVASTRRVGAALRAFAPDVVHLASPTVLGAAGMAAARRLGLPAVAVFQTDLAGFARRYRLWRSLGDEAVWAWLRRIHGQAGRTLAPSSATLAELVARGFPRVQRWGRGVDLDLFTPRRRCPQLRSRLAPAGEVLVGYVGRLAPEKRVDLLAALAGLPGVRVVVVGSGPAEGRLRRRLPGAVFLGQLSGPELARAFASLDIAVHTGPDETFCQAVQEAQASGVPVVAPARGGPLDLVRPGRTGLLVAPEDPLRLRRAVEVLARDPALRRRMGTAGRAAVLDCSWEAVVGELLGHYAAVLGVGAPLQPAA